MLSLKSLSAITVPAAKPQQGYSTTILDRAFRFTGLKAVLGAADISKAGDRGAHLAADDEIAREVAEAKASGDAVGEAAPRPLSPPSRMIEIETRGALVRVPAGVDPETLAVVLAALRRAG